MGKRAVFLIALTIAVISPAASASAQTNAPPVVVAGGLPGPTLTGADVSEQGLDELAVTVGAVGSKAALLDTETDSVPLWPEQAVVDAVGDDSVEGATRVFTGGAVNAAAATVELGFKDGSVLRLPTIAGEAYTGRYAG